MIPGPSGIEIKLQQNIQDGFVQTVVTDVNGVASFDQVPSFNSFTAFFDEGKKTFEGGGMPLYKLQSFSLPVRFSKGKGFTMEDGFIIESTLVEGHIKQQMSDSSPASFIKVVISSTEDQKVTHKGTTDANGRFQFHDITPGKYFVFPQSADTEKSSQIFKPQNRTITVELGKKTNVQSF